MKLTKEQLIKKTEFFLEEIESFKPKNETLEWYLSNNLKKYLESIRFANGSTEIRNATRILSRFCTESMNWDTDLYKKCTAITSVGFKIGKDS